MISSCAWFKIDWIIERRNSHSDVLLHLLPDFLLLSLADRPFADEQLHLILTMFVRSCCNYTDRYNFLQSNDVSLQKQQLICRQEATGIQKITWRMRERANSKQFLRRPMHALWWYHTSLNIVTHLLRLFGFLLGPLRRAIFHVSSAQISPHPPL